MSRLFPDPILYAVVGPEGALIFDTCGKALIYKSEEEASKGMGNNISSIGQLQGVRIIEETE